MPRAAEADGHSFCGFCCWDGDGFGVVAAAVGLLSGVEVLRSDVGVIALVGDGDASDGVLVHVACEFGRLGGLGGVLGGGVVGKLRGRACCTRNTKREGDRFRTRKL